MHRPALSLGLTVQSLEAHLIRVDARHSRCGGPVAATASYAFVGLGQGWRRLGFQFNQQTRLLNSLTRFNEHFLR